MFSLSFFCLSSLFADAFTILAVCLAKKVDAFCNWNINGADNPPLGLCLLVACKSRGHQQGTHNKGDVLKYLVFLKISINFGNVTGADAGQ